jgi:hypothetical protein
MTKAIRLTDLQLVLLSSAAARDNGSLIPLPENCTQDRARIGKAVAALLRRALVEELPVTDRSLAWREQDQDPLGLFITEAGRAAIGSERSEEGQDEAAAAGVAEGDAERATTQVDNASLAEPPDEPAATTDPIAAAKPAEGAPRSGSKIAAVVALLERNEGATLGEMIEATGWLPHTTRAALTGLRKKGRAITKAKRGDATCYRIESEVVA